MPELDEKTLSILKEIQMEMDYDDAVVDEEVNWQDIKTSSSDPVDMIKEKVFILKDKICRRFKKSKEVVQALPYYVFSHNSISKNFRICYQAGYEQVSQIFPQVITKFNLLSLTLMDNVFASTG